MAQLSQGSRKGDTRNAQFDLVCTAHMRKLTREVEGVMFVAAIETSTGVVLHSINRAVDLDVDDLSRAVSHLIRCHRLTQTSSRSTNPILEVMLTAHREIHILRPLRRELRIALYVAVARTHGSAARARTALSEAALALDAYRGIA